MDELAIKTCFKTLAEAAISVMGEEHKNDRARTAMYDSESDQRFTSLESFTEAEAALRNLDLFRDRYGEQSNRVTLQFIYELFKRIEQPRFEDAKFEDTWASFWREIQQPEWVYFSVANLQNFDGDRSVTDMGDGVSIRPRSFGELRETLGWGDFELDHMRREWMEGGGGSSFILLVEHETPKTPDNALIGNVVETGVKAERMLLAMRLFKAGTIGVSRMWDVRPSSFSPPGGLTTRIGLSSGGAPGATYLLKASDIQPIQELYRLIERFESSHENRLQNIRLALRTFSSIYGRSLFQGTDRVVDGVTALEALLPTNAELAFKLAFRVAGLLANDDDQRTTYFDNMKAYYNTRSKVVHGSSLNNKDRELMRDDEPLRSSVRRLLVGFLHLAESTKFQLGNKFYQQQLDKTLLHSEKRIELRKAMKLE